MKLLDLAGLYLLAGALIGGYIYRNSDQPTRQRLLYAALAVPLWPLWAPFALLPRGQIAVPPVVRLPGLLAEVSAALDETVSSTLGTPFERLFGAPAATQIREEVERVATRHAELSDLLSRPSYDPGLADRRLQQLEGAGNARARRSARLHLENVVRLAELRDRDARSLEELAGLVRALRTQLTWARYSGSSAQGVGCIVSELWARVEGLDQASDEVFPPFPGEALDMDADQVAHETDSGC